MTRFVDLEAIAAYLPQANIDTDAMIPARFLRTITRKGLGSALFATMRNDPAFLLNRPPWDRAGILIAHENVGCGSSREHAAWGLIDFGFRCVVAPSFADIFHGNCLKNGILPVRLPRATVERLGALALDPHRASMRVDLPAQTIVAMDGTVERFEIDPDAKGRLLDGTDDIARTLDKLDLLRRYEARIAPDAERYPTLDPATLLSLLAQA